MARLARFYIKNQPQHIIQRGNNRIDIFNKKQDYEYYLSCLTDAAKQNKLKIHAYVLMTNHVHLLASPQEETSIPKTMQSVGRRYVQYFNYHNKRTGTLWEGRYRATLIDSEQYLLTCMRYIELNPVRASNMVKHPSKYPWSSYLYNAKGQQNELISEHQIYLSLGNNVQTRCAAYKALFKDKIDLTELDTIRSATNKAWVLGSDRFKKNVTKKSNRRSAPLPKGRPSQVL